MTEITGFHSGQRLLRLNADTGNRPSTFTLFGREWDLLDGVFAPVYCYSTQLFAGWLDYPVGGSFLEVGSGSGVVAVTAALRGCRRVTALDVSEVAVENTRRNVARHRVGDTVRVLRSDLFDRLNADEQFDIIFWNSSFVEPPEDYVARSELDSAIFDPGYRAHRRFLSSAARHLAPGGRLLLGFGSIGNGELLARIAAEAGMHVRELHSSGHRLVKDLRYQLLEIQ